MVKIMYMSLNKNLISVARRKAIIDEIKHCEGEIRYLRYTLWGKSFFNRISIKLEILSYRFEIRKLKRKLKIRSDKKK